MSTFGSIRGLLFVLGALLAVGCAPELLAMNVANPARDRGRRYPFQPAGAVHETTAQGHLGATLHDDSVDGAFAVPVGAETRFVVLQIRPVTDRGCTAVDFRWDFQA